MHKWQPNLVSRTWLPTLVLYQTVNTLRPRQNGCHFADDIFKCILLNENAQISLKISLKIVPKVWINNIPTLVQKMAWRRPGDKHYLNQWWLVYWRIYASLGLNELKKKIAWKSEILKWGRHTDSVKQQAEIYLILDFFFLTSHGDTNAMSNLQARNRGLIQYENVILSV